MVINTNTEAQRTANHLLESQMSLQKSLSKLSKLSSGTNPYSFGSDKQYDLKEPTLIEIEPTLGCNLRCKMCHVPYMNLKKFKFLDIDNIDWGFCKDKTVTIGATFEPCIHPNFNQLIDKLNNLNASIILVTNGHNLNKKEIPALFESKLEMVTFSFDGISKDKYEEVRVGGNYHQTIKNIEKFRNESKNNNTYFAINFTVLKSNLSDVPNAPVFWDDRGFDALRLIGMVVREDDPYILKNNLWSARKEYYEALEKAAENVIEKKLKISVESPYFKERFKSSNGILISGNHMQRFKIPVHHQYEFGEDSILDNNCKSPFTSVRITWDGGVHLCHYHGVGNLLTESFSDIWKGEAASALREKIIGSGEICSNCDYYKYCIKSHHLDTTDPSNYFSQHFMEKIKSTA